MAHEGIGSGLWEDSPGVVLTTSREESLINFYINDRKHPRLQLGNCLNTEVERGLSVRTESTHDDEAHIAMLSGRKCIMVGSKQLRFCCIA
jgi:hypothetical protein